MFRIFFIHLSKASRAQRWITRWSFSRRAARRFVAGETLNDAIQAVQTLNGKGRQASLDFLGENVSTAEEANRAAEEIRNLLDAIQNAQVAANVSIKLSQLGLTLGEKIIIANLECVLAKAQEYGNFIRLDMEDSTLTERTLDVLFAMRARGYGNAGLVIQSCLYRSEEDIRRLMAAGVRVRLCKGAYREPPAVAFPRKVDVDRNYDHLVTLLLERVQAGDPAPAGADGRFPPLVAIATHDPHRIAFARQEMDRLGLAKQAVEFQMLYGIRRDLQQQLVEQGYPVRVYVPYGSHWYPYFMRRLAERPANVWFFITNFLRR